MTQHRDDGNPTKYFSMMLHIDHEDLNADEFYLLAYYRKIIGLNYGKPCEETTAETAKGVKWKVDKTRDIRAKLAEKGVIQITERSGKAQIVALADRNAANIERMKAQFATTSENSGRGKMGAIPNSDPSENGGGVSRENGGGVQAAVLKNTNNSIHKSTKVDLQSADADVPSAPSQPQSSDGQQSEAAVIAQSGDTAVPLVERIEEPPTSSAPPPPAEIAPPPADIPDGYRGLIISGDNWQQHLTLPDQKRPTPLCGHKPNTAPRYAQLPAERQRAVCPDCQKAAADRAANWDLRRGFAVLCYSTSAAYDQNAAKINTALSRIAGVSIEGLRAFQKWWRAEDWRGKKQQLPKPFDVVELYATAQVWYAQNEGGYDA